jgi:hypothetical protein
MFDSVKFLSMRPLMGESDTRGSKRAYVVSGPVVMVRSFTKPGFDRISKVTFPNQAFVWAKVAI